VSLFQTEKRRQRKFANFLVEYICNNICSRILAPKSQALLFSEEKVVVVVVVGTGSIL
jgi:hypothetical protein